MRIEIRGRTLPGLVCGPYTNIHIAIQRVRDNIEAFPANANSVSWNFDCRTVETDGGIDFRGDYVQGKRGERFVYLSWGEVDAEGRFTMFGRIKLMLDGVPAQTLSRALQPGTRLLGSLELTSPKGGPRYAAVRPPAIEWTAVPD
jgi:hypothetical protein